MIAMPTVYVQSARLALTGGPGPSTNSYCPTNQTTAATDERSWHTSSMASILLTRAARPGGRGHGPRGPGSRGERQGRRRTDFVSPGRSSVAPIRAADTIGEAWILHRRPSVIRRASARRPISSWLLGLFAALWMGGMPGRAQQPAVPSLLQPLGDGRMLAGAAQPGTLDARAVSVNLDALAADVIDVLVPSGLVIRATLDRREGHRNGAQTWAGHVAGAPYSSVTLVSFAGVVQGSIRTLDEA